MIWPSSDCGTANGANGKGITARITIVILWSKIPGPKETIHLFKDLVKDLAIPRANKYESLSNRFQMKWGP